MSLATEERFVSEQQLHDAIARFPELIPHDRFGLGRLAVLAREFPSTAGYADLILVDEFGQLVICEIKKGSENTDVRRVVAQMLDYGAALWQTDITAFEQTVRRCEPKSEETLAGLIAARVGSVTEPESIRLRVEQCLTEGDFVFLYIVRDLDQRTERVVQYLTSRPRLPFFVVEVDNFRAGDDSLLIPRAVGVPPWVNGSPTLESPTDSAAAEAVMRLMEPLVSSLELTVRDSATGRRYYSHLGDAYIGVYRSSRGIEIGLAGIIDAGHSDVAARVRDAIRASGLPVKDAVRWPMFRSEAVRDAWPALSTTALPLFFGNKSNEQEAAQRPR